ALTRSQAAGRDGDERRVTRARRDVARTCFASRLGGLAALPIHLRRLEHLVGVAEVEDQAAEVALLERDRAVEAADAPGVARAGADLLDAQPQRVLVAVDTHLDDALGVARAFALLPQLLARAAVEPGLAAHDGLGERLGIHVRDHQHLGRPGVSDHTGDQAFA